MTTGKKSMAKDQQKYWLVPASGSGFTIIEFIISWFAIAAAASALMTLASIRFQKLNYEKSTLTAVELQLKMATLLTDDSAWQATFSDPTNSTGTGSFTCLPSTVSCDSGGAFKIIDGSGNTFFDPSDTTSNGFSQSSQLCDFSTDSCLFTYNLSWERVTEFVIRITAQFEKSLSHPQPMNPKNFSVVLYKYIGP